VLTAVNKRIDVGIMPSQMCNGSRLCNNHLRAREEKVRDFVIIGNGPSGITLSYLLSGNWPYYRGISQDEFLHARLQTEPDLSLVEQDMTFLSDGLEGRSNNPVSLLFDTLQKPEADLGLQLPSLLDWRLNKGDSVDHVVLGRGRPGGVWQTLDTSLLTVSLGSWMELPNLSMSDWQEKKGTKVTKEVGGRVSMSSVSQYYKDYVDMMELGEKFHNHTVVTEVKQVQGVGEKSLETEIVQNEIFTFDREDDETGDISSQCSSITTRLSSQSLESSPPSPRRSVPGSRGMSTCSQQTEDYGLNSLPACLNCLPNCVDSLPNWDPILNPSLFSPLKQSLPSDLALYSASICESYNSMCKERSCFNLDCIEEDSQQPLFEVSGYELSTDGAGRKLQPFKYLTRNVVLATGQSDRPNRLGVPGEDLNFVLHSLADLEALVKDGSLTPNSDPVMVVGSGLSAADTIINAQTHGLSIVHVFRKSADDPGLIYNKLPVKLYPEYHAVHDMMASGLSDETRLVKGEKVEREYPGYRAVAEAEVVHISKDRRVHVKVAGEDKIKEIQVSCVLVLVGALPDLSFLGEHQDIGRLAETEVDRNNLVHVDVFTHQSVKVPGLFALGPLTGDNFVRFIQGGALAITSYIVREKKRRSQIKSSDTKCI